MSHSKRNTSLAFFTAHERAELRGTWGSQATRLTRESFLPFGSCQLCLLPTRDPVACASHGHLFCRECAVSNLLAQNKELKRLKNDAERRRKDGEEEKELEDAEAKAKDVEDFERVQAGLNGRWSNASSHGTDQELRGIKRKLESSDSTTTPSSQLESEKRGDAKRRALLELTHDGTEPADQGATSFWVPSQMPQNKLRDQQPLKQHPTCPASESSSNTHPLTLKTLVTVHFTEEEGSAGTDSPRRICPSCNKVLSNASKAVLAKPCGHVLCKACSDKFQRAEERSAHASATGVEDPGVRCYVCQEDVSTSTKSGKDTEEGVKKAKDKEKKVERGLVELSSEGTGFAGAGKNMVKKQGLAFQC